VKGRGFDRTTGLNNLGEGAGTGTPDQVGGVGARWGAVHRYGDASMFDVWPQKVIHGGRGGDGKEDLSAIGEKGSSVWGPVQELIVSVRGYIVRGGRGSEEVVGKQAVR